jgi:hypothetical protein
MTEHGDNGLIKYSTWPSSGTTIDNEWSEANNGTAADNDYFLLPSGATSFKFNDTTDKITCANVVGYDNLAAVTWEFIVSYTASASYRTLWSKQVASPTYFYVIGVDSSGHVFIYRSATDGGDSWVTDEVLTTGTWYTIQITWEPGYPAVSGATPVIKINNVACTLTHPEVATGNWGSDAGVPSIVGARLDGSTYTWLGSIALHRYHNAALSTAYLTDNYNNDKWRYLDVNVDLPSVGAIAEGLACNIGYGVIADVPCVGAIAEGLACNIEYCVIADVPCAGAIATASGVLVLTGYDDYIITIIDYDDPITDGFETTVKGTLTTYDLTETPFKTVMVLLGTFLHSGDNVVVKTVSTDDEGVWIATWIADLSDFDYDCVITAIYNDVTHTYEDYKNTHKDQTAKPTTSLTTATSDEYYRDELFTLSVILTDDEDDPILNATVELWRDTGSGYELLLSEATSSGVDGSYNFEIVESPSTIYPVTYHYKVVYDGDFTHAACQSEETDIIIFGSTNSVITISTKQSYVPAKSQVKITASVTNNGLPILNIPVQFWAYTISSGWKQLPVSVGLRNTGADGIATMFLQSNTRGVVDVKAVTTTSQITLNDVNTTMYGSESNILHVYYGQPKETEVSWLV